MNIKIKADIFAAVSLFRGQNDVRYYLNGLYLETGPKELVWLLAMAINWQ